MILARGMLSTFAPFRSRDGAGPLKRLREARVDVSLRQNRAGVSCLRLSPHFYNTEAEIEEVVKILLSYGPVSVL